jgi:hypothetical protein
VPALDHACGDRELSTLTARIRAAIAQDRWDNNTRPEAVVEILRGIAAEIEQEADQSRRRDR